MNLSNDLVNKFVEITNDETPNKEGSTAYGVTVQYGDRMYVKLDGSDLLTPVETTSAIKSGERVTVLIKDHNATVTGNLSDPSASSKDLTDVGDKIAEVDILIADKVDTKVLVAETARIEELIATKASIGQLEADRAEIEHLIANKAEITDLEAINADIEILDAEVADIETLVNGHLTSDNIQSLVLTSDKVTVDDAFIKDAMIANVSANKITSGQINTSLVSISSEDGSMTLNGSTQQFKDSEGTVRIQIGKDAEGNFTFCLFSQDGVGILLDEEGIHAGAVPDGLIVNDMVADNANISGGKLDINSVITSINNGTTTIDSSRIYLDEESQSLKVAFNSLKTKVETIEETSVDGDLSSVMEQITSNTTNIETMQGQISSLISTTTITKENGEVVSLKDDYNITKDTVDSHSTKIGSLESTVNDVTSKQTSMELDLGGFRTEVSDTYATKVSVDQGIPNMIPHTDFGVSNSVENWRCWNSAELYLTTSTWNSDAIIAGMIYGQRVMRLRWVASEANVAGHTYSACAPNQHLTLKANTQYAFSVYLHVGGFGAKQGYFRFYAMKDDGTTELCYNSPKYAMQDDYRKVEVTFTTSEATEYDLRFYIDAEEGATQNAYLTIHQPMLNIGTTSAIWRARTEDIETSIVTTTQSKIDESSESILLEVSSTYATKDELTGLGSGYVTKTEFEQTSEDFTFRISQGGGGNLLRNSDFYDVMNEKWDYWKFWGNCYQFTSIWLLYESFVDAMIIDNQSTSTQGGFYQEVWGIQPNVEYTLSVNLAWGTNAIRAYIAVEYYSTDGTMLGSIIPDIVNDIDTRQSFTFTTPADCVRVNVVFNHNGSTDGSSAFYVIQRPCLVEGYGAVWVPHSKELYDGIVKIDKYGLTVEQGDNKSILDSEALKFYNGTTNYSRIQGGLFKFTDPDGTAVGAVGRSKWAASQNYMTSVHAEYGHSTGLGVMYNSTDTTYTDPLWLVSQSGTDTTGTTYSEQGLNISSACVFGSFKYKNTMTDTGFSMQMGSYGADSGSILGAESLKLGVSMGNAFIHTLDMSATNYVYTDCYSPINMHGYNIYNTGSVTSLSARTDYTSSLLNTGSNDFYTYNNMSYYQGEVRWCWKEPVFTYPEADVDPETDEWIYTGRNICYIELPIFIAENIEENYHISIGKIGWGDYRIVEKNPYYFIIESQEEDFAFTFEIVAKLIDSETTSTNAVVANASIQTEATPNIPNEDEEFKGLEIPIENFEGYNNIEES